LDSEARREIVDNRKKQMGKQMLKDFRYTVFYLLLTYVAGIIILKKRQRNRDSSVFRSFHKQWIVVLYPELFAGEKIYLNAARNKEV
jgi:hypothetical protein